MITRELLRKGAGSLLWDAFITTIAIVALRAWGFGFSPYLVGVYLLLAGVCYAASRGYDEPFETGQDSDASSALETYPPFPKNGDRYGASRIIGSSGVGMFGICRNSNGRDVWLMWYSKNALPDDCALMGRREQLHAAAVLLESLQGLSLADASAYRAASAELTREILKTEKAKQ